jgi:hypothetical protein
LEAQAVQMPATLSKYEMLRNSWVAHQMLAWSFRIRRPERTLLPRLCKLRVSFIPNSFLLLWERFTAAHNCLSFFLTVNIWASTLLSVSLLITPIPFNLPILLTLFYDARETEQRHVKRFSSEL